MTAEAIGTGAITCSPSSDTPPSPSSMNICSGERRPAPTH
jgi:hypothetical protein